MQDLDAQLVDPPAKPAQAVIALGSNLGQSRRILHDAVEGFRQADNVWVTAVSPLAKTAPVGGPEQPDFLNQVLIIRSEEHTSELQSRGHLVCRLLLEKKN